MTDLIKIEKHGEREAVNARELHEFLENNRKFSDWIKQRIEQYGFVEKSDFTVHKFVIGKATQKDYFISLDMAKELSMVENNEKGRQARRYFIECEKQAIVLSTPKTFAEALRLAADQQEKIEQQKMLIEEQAPKAKFYDTVTDSKTAIYMSDVAKVIDCGIGRNKLFSLLRDKKVLDCVNRPYQKYVDRKYFRVVERSNTDKNGNSHISITTLVYQKGVDYISKLVKEIN